MHAAEGLVPGLVAASATSNAHPGPLGVRAWTGSSASTSAVGPLSSGVLDPDTAAAMGAPVSASTAPPSLLPLCQLVSELELEERLGRGGGGTTWRCRWRGAPAAVKLMVSPGDEALTFNTREALCARSLSHPCVVQCYAITVTRITDQDLELLEAPRADRTLLQSLTPPHELAIRVVGGGGGGDGLGPAAASRASEPGSAAGGNAEEACVGPQSAPTLLGASAAAGCGGGGGAPGGDLDYGGSSEPGPQAGPLLPDSAEPCPLSISESFEWSVRTAAPSMGAAEADAEGPAPGRGRRALAKARLLAGAAPAPAPAAPSVAAPSGWDSASALASVDLSATQPCLEATALISLMSWAERAAPGGGGGGGGSGSCVLAAPSSSGGGLNSLALFKRASVGTTTATTTAATAATAAPVTAAAGQARPQRLSAAPPSRPTPTMPEAAPGAETDVAAEVAEAEASGGAGAGEGGQAPSLPTRCGGDTLVGCPDVVATDCSLGLLRGAVVGSGPGLNLQPPPPQTQTRQAGGCQAADAPPPPLAPPPGIFGSDCDCIVSPGEGGPGVVVGGGGVGDDVAGARRDDWSDSLGLPGCGGGGGGGACDRWSVLLEPGAGAGEARGALRRELRRLGAAPGRFLTCIVMDWCDGGTLHDAFAAPPQLPQLPPASAPASLHCARLLAASLQLPGPSPSPSRRGSGSGGGGAGGGGPASSPDASAWPHRSPASIDIPSAGSGASYVRHPYPEKGAYDQEVGRGGGAVTAATARHPGLQHIPAPRSPSIPPLLPLALHSCAPHTSGSGGGGARSWTSPLRGGSHGGSVRACASPPLPPPGSGGGRRRLAVLLRCALEVAQGLSYLHSLGLAHGDLTPRNVLLKSSATSRRGFTCKLADFGLARPAGGNTAASASASTSTATAPSTATAGGTGGTAAPAERWGALPYLAPDALTGRGSPQQADVYSFGAVLWYMATGRQPFQGLRPPQLLVGLATGEVALSWPAWADPWVARLGAACTHPDPARRPDMDSVARMLLERLRAPRQHQQHHSHPQHQHQH